MKKATFISTLALPLLVTGSLSLPVLAQDANMIVKHVAVSTGADGIKRTIEYAESIVRRDNQVWIERVMPVHLHDSEAHKNDEKGHKHLDVATAARWVVRKPDGKIGVQLAAHEERALVNIAKVDYENIGFDGSWEAAYYLIDPEMLKRMKVMSTQGNLTTYTSNEANNSVKVVWNNKLKLPVSVDVRKGTSSSRTTVEVLSQTKRPWDAVTAYQTKEYADYLD